MLTVSTSARPKSRFDPAGFRAAKRAYDGGAHGRLIGMMRETEQSSHVQGCLIGRKAGYKRSWLFRPTDEGDQDAERIQLARRHFQKLRLFDLFDDMIEARLYKYAVLDFEWEMVDGLQVPVHYEAFEQHHFAYDKADQRLKLRERGQLEDFDRLGEGGTAIVCEWHKQPIMLPVLRDYILAEFGVETWASFLESWGEPILIGKYPAGAGADFRKEVEQAVDAVAVSSRGTAPQGTDFEVIESDRRTGDHKEFKHDAEAGIAIGILGHANAVRKADGFQVGQDNAPFQVRREIADDDVRWLMPCVQPLLDEYWRRNYGSPPPEFEIDLSKPVNTGEQLKKLDQAYRMGGHVHYSELQKLGLRIRTPEEGGEEWLIRSQTQAFLD